MIIVTKAQKYFDRGTNARAYFERQHWIICIGCNLHRRNNSKGNKLLKQCGDVVFDHIRVGVAIIILVYNIHHSCKIENALKERHCHSVGFSNPSFIWLYLSTRLTFLCVIFESPLHQRDRDAMLLHVAFDIRGNMFSLLLKLQTYIYM